MKLPLFVLLVLQLWPSQAVPRRALQVLPSWPLNEFEKENRLLGESEVF